MARPRIFVSSTYYDLKHLRSSLENFIESMGFDPVLSEKGDVAYVPDLPLDESCYREVGNTDIYVLIIGGRYGSERGGQKASKAFLDRYDSITKMEYKTAANQDIPVYVLIERAVYGDYENFLRNRTNDSFNYAHVDSVNIFFLIEEILSQPRNNPVYQFERYSDIEAWLREQWAGMFKELLARSSSHRQLASLSAQVTQLAEFNQTLKRYLEEVMVKVAPAESAKLIEHESNRLAAVSQWAKLRRNDLVEYIIAVTGLPISRVAEILRECPTVEKLVSRIKPLATNPKSNLVGLDELLSASSAARRDLADARAILGLETS